MIDNQTQLISSFLVRRMVAQYKWKNKNHLTAVQIQPHVNSDPGTFLDLGKVSTLAASVRIPILIRKEMESREKPTLSQQPLAKGMESRERPTLSRQPFAAPSRTIQPPPPPFLRDALKRPLPMDPSDNSGRKKGRGEQQQPQLDADFHMLNIERLRQAGTNTEMINMWRENAILRVQMLCYMHTTQQYRDALPKLITDLEQSKLEIERLRMEAVTLKNAALKCKNQDLKHFVCNFQGAFKDKDRLKKIVEDIVNSK